MLKTTAVLLVLALIAALVGFVGDRGLIVGLARVAFLVLLVYSLIGLLLGKPSRME